MRFFLSFFLFQYLVFPLSRPCQWMGHFCIYISSANYALDLAWALATECVFVIIHMSWTSADLASCHLSPGRKCIPVKDKRASKLSEKSISDGQLKHCSQLLFYYFIFLAFWVPQATYTFTSASLNTPCSRKTNPSEDC